jgi:hypothetical protein
LIIDKIRINKKMKHKLCATTDEDYLCINRWHNENDDEQFGNMVDSTGALIFCDKGLRKHVFYMNIFRERRGIFESSRRTL